MKILKYDVPDKLFNDYIRFTKLAEEYLLKKRSTPSDGLPGADYERQQRWLSCSKKVMEIHLEICKAIGIKHDEEIDDPFYIAFRKAVRKALGEEELE